MTLARALAIVALATLATGCSIGGDPRLQPFVHGATSELSQLADAALDHARDSLGSTGRVTEARLARIAGDWARVRVARDGQPAFELLLRRGGGRWRAITAKDRREVPGLADSIPHPLFSPSPVMTMDPGARVVTLEAMQVSLESSAIRAEPVGGDSAVLHGSEWVVSIRRLPADRVSIEALALAEARAEAVARAHPPRDGHPLAPTWIERDAEGDREWVQALWTAGDSIRRVVHVRPAPGAPVVRLDAWLEPEDDRGTAELARMSRTLRTDVGP